MEQRIQELFATIEIALDDSIYTFSDSEYLVRRELIRFLDEQNALVASARQISAADVVDTVIASTISSNFDAGDPIEWLREAAGTIVDFSELAFDNEISAVSGKFCSLLPDGHPRAERVVPMTASAAKEAYAQWMAADPRLSEDAAKLVYQIYSTPATDDLDLNFRGLKLEALVASGEVPEEVHPLVAGFNMSRALRSKISAELAKWRRRDRKGRFANEFGRFKNWFKGSDGNIFSATNRIVGPGPSDNTYIVQADGSNPKIPKGLYVTNASLGESVDAYISKKSLSRLLKGKKGPAAEYVSPADAKDAVSLDEFLASKVDMPQGWSKVQSKNGQVGYKNQDGISAFRASKSQVDALENKGHISGTGEKDAIDPNNPDLFVIKDSKGNHLGVAQDWAGIQETALINSSSSDSPNLDTADSKSDLKYDKDGNSYSFDNHNGGVNMYKDDNGDWVVDTNYETMLDESTPGSLEDVKKFKSEAEAKKYGEYYAQKLKNDDKTNELWQEAYDQKFDSNISVKQSAPAEADMSKYSDQALADGYAFSKDAENAWEAGETPDGNIIKVEQGSNGKWYVSEHGGSAPDGYWDKDLQSFDSREEAFDWANSQLATPRTFDKATADDTQGDLDGDVSVAQAVPSIPGKVDRGRLSPGNQKKYEKDLNALDKAISENNRVELQKLIERHAMDDQIDDAMWSVVNDAPNALDAKKLQVDNAIYNGTEEDLKGMLDNPEYAGWHDRIQDALDSMGDISVNQQAPDAVKQPSAAQLEPATAKQYSLLQEYLDERDLDPATAAAITDALKNKNLTKHQVNSLIGPAKSAGFKEGVDGTKPSTRMLDSLQGYLSTKDLKPSEIKEVLDSLEADGSRDNVENLLNKMRRKKDKPVELNQSIGHMSKAGDGYQWEDVYNSVSAVKNADGSWSVDYTNPDLNDRGGQTFHSQRFNSEKEALDFANGLVKQNQDDDGFGRAADNAKDGGDISAAQSVPSKLDEPATDAQYNFIESMLDTKEITDPELVAAIRDSLNGRNLSKGQAGAYIGQLRAANDKPNAVRQPTAKQVASIKRGMLERGLSPEERKSIQDKIDAGLTFDEASDIITDLKSRDMSPEGVSELINGMDSVDDLQALKARPEYADFADQIDSRIDELAGSDISVKQDIADSRDIDAVLDAINKEEVIEALSDGGFDYVENEENFDWTSPDGKVNIFIEDDFGSPVWVARVNGKRVASDLFVDKENLGNEIVSKLTEADISVKQDIAPAPNFNTFYPHNTAQLLERILRDKAERMRAEGASEEEIQKVRALSGFMRDIRTRPRRWGERSPSEMMELSPEQAKIALDALNEFTADPNNDERLDILGGVSADAKKNAQARKALFGKLESISKGEKPTEPKRLPTDKQIASIRRGALERGLSEEEAAKILDNIEDLSFDDASKIISDLKSRPITDEGIDNLINNSELDVLESIVDRPDYAPWKDKIQSKIDEIRDGEADISVKQATPDSNGVSSRSVTRQDLVNEIADALDAEDRGYLYSGDELKTYLDEFDNAKYPSTAAEMSNAIYEMSNSVKDPELRQRLRELSLQLDDEMADRFGVAEAARMDGADFIDLDDVDSAIDTEREMYFETDADKISDTLDQNGNYGDSRSGGAEARVTENGDGTYTASVDYDRDGEEQTFDDRDEAIAWAAGKVSDYNYDVRPSEYGDSSDLANEAAAAKTDAEAAAFADRLDALADALDNNRGDQNVSRSLREYGERIRDMIAQREANNQANVPDDVTTPETMDEMATDPELNPAGYAKSVGNDLYKKMGGDSSGVAVGEGTFTSSDGRVQVTIEGDPDGLLYAISIDGETINTGLNGTADEIASEIDQLVQDHFSKKA